MTRSFNYEPSRSRTLCFIQNNCIKSYSTLLSACVEFLSQSTIILKYDITGLQTMNTMTRECYYGQWSLKIYSLKRHRVITFHQLHCMPEHFAWKRPSVLHLCTTTSQPLSVCWWRNAAAAVASTFTMVISWLTSALQPLLNLGHWYAN